MLHVTIIEIRRIARRAIPAMPNHETWSTNLINNNRQKTHLVGFAQRDSAAGHSLLTATSTYWLFTGSDGASGKSGANFRG